MPTHRLNVQLLRGAGAKSAGLSVCLALAGLSQCALAQSLGDLYSAARGYDAAFNSARAQLDSAAHRAEQAKALNRASAALNVTAARNTSSTPYSTAVTGSAAQAGSAAVSGSKPLFNRANDASIEQALKSVSVAELDLAQTEQDLIVRVAQAYFDVLAARDSLRTAQTNKTAIAEQLASAKRNFEVGTATITDTREAQARFDLSTAQEIAATNDLRVKSAALDQLVGRAGVDPWPLLAPIVLPGLMPASAEDWVQSGQGMHPVIRKAALGLEIARLETTKARAGSLPTVALTGQYGQTQTDGTANIRSQTGTTQVAQKGTASTSNVSVTLSMPLYSGYAIENRVKETLSLEEKASADLDSARRSVALGTRQAFLGVQSLAAQVSALEAAESSSKLALEATQLGYKVGVRVNLDVLNSQTQLYSTQRDLAKARYDVIVGGLRLRQASGVLAEADVLALSPLLAKP